MFVGMRVMTKSACYHTACCTGKMISYVYILIVSSRSVYAEVSLESSENDSHREGSLNAPTDEIDPQHDKEFVWENISNECFTNDGHTACHALYGVKIDLLLYFLITTG